ncbi:hypothetical protein [Streptomyces bauhiniae]|uniref:hypothetical protein n=1 Tax=Streptomyces bauhiniae TaxID=2340725 RepID=UPI0035DB3524
MPQSFRLDWNGDHIARELRQAAAHGLLLAAEHVLQQSQDVVPLDEDPLMQSGMASVDPASLTAMVSYDTPYAVRQHEETTWRHAPGRTAKYLENPLNAAASVVPQIIAAQLRRALR